MYVNLISGITTTSTIDIA